MPIRIEKGRIVDLSKGEKKIRIPKKTQAKKKQKVEGKVMGPIDCPFAKKIGDNLYKCTKNIYYEPEAINKPIFTCVRLKVGASLCLDCDRELTVIRKVYMDDVSGLERLPLVIKGKDQLIECFKKDFKAMYLGDK